MAMTKCRECGHEISTKASACPSCGAKIRRTSALTGLVAVFLVIVAAIAVPAMISGQKATEQRAAETAAAHASKTPEQRAAEAAEKAQSEAEFARVRSVARAIKANAKNPKSFELVDALYMPGGAICITHRGTNSFNAVVTDHTAVDKNNKVGDWNRLCGGKTGTSYRHAGLGL